MKFLFLYLFLFSNLYAATCTTTTRNNYSSGQVLTSSALNADLNQLVSKVNSLDGGCITDATLEESALQGTLSVSKGGTSLSTLTANNLLVGNGTGAIAFIAPSTANNLLQSDGTSWSSVTDNRPKILGYTGNSSAFAVAFYTTSIGIACNSSPCAIDQLGTDVSSITRLGAGSYSLNMARTYTKLRCTGNATAAQYLTVTTMSCNSCSSLTFQTPNLGATLIDSTGTLNCLGTY